ncbi:MAG: hypothetical protein HZB46_13175 [Solirubrobacterales bacterium]|nr:hypothetical protein [Solirubrobacterales bacterium]
MQTERTVLVVVRTITTVAWLFDILPELVADTRIQVLFTLNGRPSAYEAGVAEAVAALGGRVLPWEQAVATDFELAISASHYGDLHQLRSPLLILPHGPGYSKTISLPGDGVAPLPATQAETMVALSHAEQGRQWRADDGTRPVVVGDPCFDRLVASVAQRHRYRRALGVRDDQKLILTSTTWGRRAALAVAPDLPARLVGELPSDEYVVAAVLHPNIWVGHGAWQVRLWMHRALEGGLRLIPLRDGWRGALVAADLLVGDHGSVALYAIGLGVPVVFAAFGRDELVPGTPLAELDDRAPHLDLDAPLAPQVAAHADALGRPYDDLAARVFGEHGRALLNLRAAIYAQLDLEPPGAAPRVLPVSVPCAESQTVRSYLVGARVDGTSVVLERFPATVEPSHLQLPARHLAVHADEPHTGLRESAAVLCCTRPHQDVVQARAASSALLRAHPGCRVAVAGDNARRLVVSRRDGPPLLATGGVSPDVLGSAVYASVLGNVPPAERIGIRVGAAEHDVALTPLSRTAPQAAP